MTNSSSAPRTIDFRHAPPTSWTCIGFPDDPHKTLVDERGRLLYDFQRGGARFGTFRFGRVVSFALYTDAQPIAIRQRTESARFPLVITTIDYPHARLILRTFAHQPQPDRRSDIVLWQIEPAPDQPEVISALWLQIQAADSRFAPAGLAPSPYIYAFPPGDFPRWRGLDDLFTQHRDPDPAQVEQTPFLVSLTHPLQVDSAYDHGPASGLRTDFAQLPHPSPPHTGEGTDSAPPPQWRRLGGGEQSYAGKSYSGAFVFPQNHGQVVGLDEAWAQEALEESRRFWAGYRLLPERFSIPDPGVMDMLTAAARNIAQAREIQGELAQFQVGPTVYRGFWVIDGYFFLEAAHFLGWQREARQGIDILLRRVRPNGAIEERSLDTKDTGLALATLVRQCELNRDYAQLRRLWPTLQRAVEYARGLHRSTFSLPPDAPEYGLLPKSFGNGGLGGLRAEYTTVLWMLAGIRAVVRAAGHLGLAEEEAEIQGFYDQLFAALRRHAAADQVNFGDGQHFLPMLKPGSGSHHWIHDFIGEPKPWERVNPGTGTWAMAHAIYPGEIFDPQDPLVQGFCHFLDEVDDAEGIPAATGWLPFQALWSYAASFYAHVWLYAGHPQKAIDYLYAFANHAAPTRVWREEQSLAESRLGQKVGDMPHNWASAEFVRLVRNLLVFEAGQKVHLLPGLPEEWLVAGEVLEIETPTAYGTVHLRLEIDSERRGGRLAIAIAPNGLAAPDGVQLTVPTGSGFQLEAVTLQGQPVEIAGQRVVDFDWPDASLS